MFKIVFGGDGYKSHLQITIKFRGKNSFISKHANYKNQCS